MFYFGGGGGGCGLQKKVYFLFKKKNIFYCFLFEIKYENLIKFFLYFLIVTFFFHHNYYDACYCSNCSSTATYYENDKISENYTKIIWQMNKRYIPFSIVIQVQ